MKPFPIANCITALRVPGTLALLLLRPFSPAFYAVYTLTGLTDVLDGWLARTTGTVSRLGARLDSLADLLFCGAMLWRLLPVLYPILPGTIWLTVLLTVGLRLAGYIAAAVKYHTFASLHTYLSKLTGFAVFLIPYFQASPFAVRYCGAVCILAVLAALEELLIHLFQPVYDADRRSIFQRTHSG